MMSYWPTNPGAPNAGATVYCGPRQASSIKAWAGTFDDVAAVVPYAGTCSLGRVEVTTAPGAGNNTVYTLLKNGSDTAITFTLSDTNTVAVDSTHTVSFNAGDTVGWKAVTSASSSQANPRLSVQFETSGNVSAWLGCVQSLAAATRYISINGFNSAGSTEDVSRQLCPIAGTFGGLYINLNTAPGVGTSRTFTVWLNGSPTSCAVTISDNNTTGNDTSHSFAVAKDDLLSIQCTVTGSPSVAVARYGSFFTATDNNMFALMGASGSGAPSNSAARFNFIEGVYNGGWGSTNVHFNYGPTIWLTDFGFKVVNAPTSGKSWTMAVHVDASASELSVAVADAATGGHDTGKVVVAENSALSVAITPSGTPSTTNDWYWGVGATFVEPVTASGYTNLLLLGVG